MNKTPHARDREGAATGNSERLRLPRAQLVLMFALVALFSFPPAFLGTALTVFAELRTVRWYAIFLSPGWFVLELFSPHHSAVPNGGSWIDFWGNYTYYFGLIFAFVFWADRRWRRKRAALIGNRR